MTGVWRPEVEDFIEAHNQAGMVSEIRTEGFMHSREKGVEILESIIEDSEEYSEAFELAGFFLRELVVRQPFSDGNHRTGIIVAKQVLRRNGKNFRVSEIDDAESVEDFLKWDLKFADVSEVAEWIKNGV